MKFPSHLNYDGKIVSEMGPWPTGSLLLVRTNRPFPSISKYCCSKCGSECSSGASYIFSGNIDIHLQLASHSYNQYVHRVWYCNWKYPGRASFCRARFYLRPVLAFGYCRCLRLSVCVSVCVHQPPGCSCDNSSLIQSKITKIPWLWSLLFVGLIGLHRSNVT